MIKIYHFAPSRSVRVIWQCEEMGLPYEIVPVSFPTPQSYRQVNPMGSLPFLEDGDVAINESIAMMLYLAERYGPTPLLPDKTHPALARTLQFLIFGEATLGMWGNVLRGAQLLAPEDQKDNWSVRRARARIIDGLKFTADAVGDDLFLAGPEFTLADISVGFAVGAARTRFGLENEIPRTLLAYHDRLRQRPAYQRAAAK